MKPRKTDVKTIPRFPNYAITKDGRVWSKPRRDRMNHRLGGKWLKPYPDCKGYLFVNLCLNGKRNMRRICRLVLETFVGFRPRGMQCRHLDGNNQNDKLDNLTWGTPSENQADRLIHGTSNRGSRNGHTKLSKEDVKLIFNAYHDGAYTQPYLARQFGVARTTIQAIAEKRTWKYLWETVLI